MNHQSSTDPVLMSEAPLEVLYATESFQVSVRTLLADQQIQYAPSSKEKPVLERQCIVIQGELVISGSGQILHPQRGSRFVLSGEGDWTLSTISHDTVIFLELLQGAALTPVPLKEVTEHRPWGSFTVLRDELLYKLKELIVKPGSRLSLQRHFKREEHWFVTKGQPEVLLDDAVHTLQAGEYIHIPLQSWHRITNSMAATEDVEIIELQMGDYFGEDDIERCQDDYGRQ